MALVRILVDGYSLLHAWPELARGKARHSAAARDELIHWLTRYQDATGAPKGMSRNESTGSIEVLFSKAGQTADDMIERAAHRFQPYGEVLAVTNDTAERDTVTAMGGQAWSCELFRRDMENELSELAESVNHYNRAERNRFNRTK